MDNKWKTFTEKLLELFNNEVIWVIYSETIFKEDNTKRPNYRVTKTTLPNSSKGELNTIENLEIVFNSCFEPGELDIKLDDLKRSINPNASNVLNIVVAPFIVEELKTKMISYSINMKYKHTFTHEYELERLDCVVKNKS